MRVAVLSYHTCPLATLGGKDTGGMNVYVRDLTRELGRRGMGVDVFTRSQDEHVPHVLHDLGYGNRIVHIPAGPEHPLDKAKLLTYIPMFVEGIKTFAASKHLRYDLLHAAVPCFRFRVLKQCRKHATRRCADLPPLSRPAAGQMHQHDPMPPGPHVFGAR